MTISPEAKEAAATIALLFYPPDKPHKFEDRAEQSIQLAINSATTPIIQSAKDSAANFRKSEVKRIEAEREVTNLQKEIERLRGEIEKAWREGFGDGQFGFVPSIVTEVRRDYVWQESRAKRVAEGRE